MTIREAAERLGVSVGTVHNWIHSGLLAAERVGPKKLFVNSEDVEKLVVRVEPRK
jgi:excisionase family DNA binding protein